MNTEKRDSWGSKVGFILASLGGALGLGAMWKLPYVMGQNGGGAFILLYLGFNLFLGLPLYIGELILGKQSQRGIVLSFKRFSNQDSSWALVGWMTILVVLLILGWYCVIAGWSIAYIILSLIDSFHGLSLEEISYSFDTFRHSGSMNLLFQGIFIAMNAGILLKGLNLGIEKWSKFFTTTLFLLLMALSVYSMQLSGFNEAINYIIIPDFSKLSRQGVLEALGLALFTLNIGYGANVTYGSYLDKNSDVPKTAIIVVLANLFASVLIAITIFPMVFTFGIAPSEGEGLIFKTLPYVFEQLPGSMILGVVFFILLLFAAITSSLAMLEVVVVNFTELTNMSRKKAVLLSCLLTMIVGLPVAITGPTGLFSDWHLVFGHDFMTTLYALIDWLLVMGALLTTIFVGFYLKRLDLIQGFSVAGGVRSWLFGFWLLLIRYVGPLAILLVLASRAHLIQF